MTLVPTTSPKMASEVSPRHLYPSTTLTRVQTENTLRQEMEALAARVAALEVQQQHLNEAILHSNDQRSKEDGLEDLDESTRDIVRSTWKQLMLEDRLEQTALHNSRQAMEDLKVGDAGAKDAVVEHELWDCRNEFIRAMQETNGDLTRIMVKLDLILSHFGQIGASLKVLSDEMVKHLRRYYVAAAMMESLLATQIQQWKHTSTKFDMVLDNDVIWGFRQLRGIFPIHSGNTDQSATKGTTQPVESAKHEPENETEASKSFQTPNFSIFPNPFATVEESTNLKGPAPGSAMSHHRALFPSLCSNQDHITTVGTVRMAKRDESQPITEVEGSNLFQAARSPIFPSLSMKAPHRNLSAPEAVQDVEPSTSSSIFTGAPHRIIFDTKATRPGLFASEATHDGQSNNSNLQTETKGSKSAQTALPNLPSKLAPSLDKSKTPATIDATPNIDSNKGETEGEFATSSPITTVNTSTSPDSLAKPSIGLLGVPGDHLKAPANVFYPKASPKSAISSPKSMNPKDTSKTVKAFEARKPQ